jgi:hypothetical protein
VIEEDAVERKDVDTEKKLIVDEEKESVSIGFSVFFRYYREFNGSYFFFFIINFCMITEFLTKIWTQYELGKWTK